MSKNSIVNEVLCKIIGHNLTCQIHEQEPLGIAPMFWKDEQEGVRMVRTAVFAL